MKVHDQFRKKCRCFVIVLMVYLALPAYVCSEEAPIPMPGDDSIPLPGDEAVPLPGDDAVPLPGEEEESAVPIPASTAGNVTFPFELRGYVENTIRAEYLQEREAERLLNASRVRVDLAGEPNESVDFGIGVVGTINRGATRANLIDYFPESIREQLVPEAEMLFTYRIEPDDVFVQEAFGTFYTDYFRLRAGRHKFYTGTGYAYNPIDLFNVKNPLDPTYETDGLDALLLTFDLPKQTQLQGLVRYNDRLKTSDYLARLKTYLSGWDVAVQYTHHLKERIDWEALNTEEALEELMQGVSMDDFTRTFRWHLVGAEFSGELLGFGVYGEGGYVFVEEPEQIGTLEAAANDHERLLFGMDRTFDMQLYVLCEYLRFGQGDTGRDDISLNDYMAAFSGEQLAISQDTLFTGLSYPLTDFIEGSLYTIVSLNDGSGMLNPWVMYDVAAGLKCSLSLNIPFGAEDGPNGRAGVGGFARLKLNF